MFLVMQLYIHIECVQGLHNISSNTGYSARNVVPQDVLSHAVAVVDSCSTARGYNRSVVDACVLQWGRSKHGNSLSFCKHFPQRVWKRKRVNSTCDAYSCCDGVWFRFNSLTPTLPPSPFRESTKSCLFVRHPKKAGCCSYTNLNDYPL